MADHTADFDAFRRDKPAPSTMALHVAAVFRREDGDRCHADVDTVPTSP